MKYLFLIIFLLIPLVNAETTFEDNPDDFFIMGDLETPHGIIQPITISEIDEGWTLSENAWGAIFIILFICLIILIIKIIDWIYKKVE